MSWYGGIDDYSIDINKTEFMFDFDEDAANNGWRDNGDGALSTMVWKEDETFEDYNEARNYIYQKTNGKGHMAVLYKEHKIVKTKATIKKEKNLKNLEKEVNELNTKKYFEDFKSEYIGCKECGSKINKNYIKTHKCPCCGSDLRSETELKKIKNKKEKIKKLKKEVKEATKKSKKYEVRWLIQNEYHV